ncbi:MAG: DUF3000 family protein [Micrococcales bacterium]
MRKSVSHMCPAIRRGNAGHDGSALSVNHVIEITNDSTASAAFRAVVDDLKNAKLRRELDFEQIPAPGKLAADSIAFAVHVKTSSKNETSDLGTGRFVLLHEPSVQDQWASNFRIVTFCKSPLEINIGIDEDASDLAWSWLLEALANRSAEHHNIAGTSTRIISTGHGSLENQSQHAEFELRASWSPDSNFAAHLEAWQDVVCAMSGFAIDPDTARI